MKTNCAVSVTVDFLQPYTLSFVCLSTGIMGLLCPCFQLCSVSSRMGEGFAYACCCSQIAPFTLRAKLRAEQGIQVSIWFLACYVTYFCCTEDNWITQRNVKFAIGSDLSVMSSALPTELVLLRYSHTETRILRHTLKCLSQFLHWLYWDPIYVQTNRLKPTAKMACDSAT